jgi:hypothetical protein
MKTYSLFKKYYKILNEQDPADPTAAPKEPPAVMAPPAEAPAPEPTKPLDNNEKYVIKILTNSFIFNPTLFDRSKQKFIANKIAEIKTSVNIPVAKVIEEIKSVLNLDNSLRVESKTLKLITKYLLVLEQPADATEPQSGNNAPTAAPASGTQQGGGPNINLNLAEIFPLYKELILQSLEHVPTDEELMILKPIVNEFAETDPEKIVTTIKDLLGQESDKDLETDLANA